MKRFICAILVLAMSFSLFACNNSGDQSGSESGAVSGRTLSTPENVKISESGLITWDAVKNATGYIVTINGSAVARLAETEYQADSALAFTFKVAATADGYTDSAASQLQTFTPKAVADEVIIGIEGQSEVKSGKSIQLTANVFGTSNKEVTWSVKSGAENVTISDSGKLTASNVNSDSYAVVVATSKEDPTAYAEKLVYITAKPILNQAMLDELGESEKSEFLGTLGISVYNITGHSSVVESYTLDVYTAMKENVWYAEYQDNAGNSSALYYKEHDGLASEVGLSFMNEEEYVPMEDGGKYVTWEDSGLYNNFKGLKVEDFTFNEDTWLYEYTGRDEKLPERMVASANPYDFGKVENFSLYISQGELMGFYATSAYDYSLVDGYRSVYNLVAVMNYGDDTIIVPEINKYSYSEEFHAPLKEAIENMRTLESYTTDYMDLSASVLISGYIMEGYKETVTANECHYIPYDYTFNSYGREVKTYHEEGAYGYKKINDKLYNTYMFDAKENGYVATRAYETDFNEIKPSFMYAPEIFRESYVDEDDGTITYYVDDAMAQVASLFYHGVGNDIQLYGLFATRGYTSSTSSFTPFVVVKDGHIIEACFYYNMVYMYGVVDITYSDFNSATIQDEAEFAVRNVPSTWDEVTIFVSEESVSTDDDEEVNAAEELKVFFNDEDILDKLPYFGNALGDTYGFGLTTSRIQSGTNRNVFAIVFYFDVPLDDDYTINKSMAKVEDYLVECGFEKNRYGEYENEYGIMVAVVDNALDLLVYAWKDVNY